MPAETDETHKYSVPEEPETTLITNVLVPATKQNG